MGKDDASGECLAFMSHSLTYDLRREFARHSTPCTAYPYVPIIAKVACKSIPPK